MVDLASVGLSDIIYAFVIASLLYLTVVAIWRKTGHPLAGFPGPTLAGLTGWYTAYYDIVVGGGLIDKLYELHRLYGPVVRIAPNELHFSDPRAFLEIYSPGSKFLKHEAFYKCFGETSASFVLINPAEAKARRDILNPFFSRRAILALEGVVRERVHALLDSIISHGKSGEPVNMHLAFRSTTMDIIASYAFARSFGAIEEPSHQHPFLISMQDALPMFMVLRHIPFLDDFLLSLPDSLLVWLSPGMRGFVETRKVMAKQIDSYIDNPTLLHSAEHETIFHHLLEPRHALSRRALLDEGINLMFAGTDTVGNTCSVGVFHVLNDLTIYQKLLNELRIAWPDKSTEIKLAELEKLPYLTAVIKESLRINGGVIMGLPRVLPADARIDEIDVPAGTVVSIGSTFVHFNSECFPNPHAFNPDRWLHPDAKSLDNWLVAFSKGPRSCTGVNLAWSELYTIFAHIFRRLDLQIHDTTVEDFIPKAYFQPVYKKPFQALVKERID